MNSEAAIAVPLLHVLGVGCIALGASFVVASLFLGESAWLLGGMGLWFTGMMALGTPRTH